MPIESVEGTPTTRIDVETTNVGRKVDTVIVFLFSGSNHIEGFPLAVPEHTTRVYLSVEQATALRKQLDSVLG